MHINDKTTTLVLSAMMICLILVATLFFKIPIPGTQGYIHLGDAMIFLSVMMLGRKYGILSSIVGSTMGDLLSGFAIWAPWTILIKFVMAFIISAFCIYAEKHCKEKIHLKLAVLTTGMFISGLFMCAGYFVAEGIIYGNFLIALIGIPWNIAQFVIGIVLALPLAMALCKTSARKIFYFPL